MVFNLLIEINITMNNRDTELIWEAYNEEILDEGLKDTARKVIMAPLIAATMAGASPNASAQEYSSPPIEQVESGLSNIRKSLSPVLDAAKSVDKIQNKKKESHYRLLRQQDNALGEITPYEINPSFKVNGDQEVVKLYDYIVYLAQHTRGHSTDVQYLEKKVAESSLGIWREGQGELEYLQKAAVNIYKQLVSQRLNK